MTLTIDIDLAAAMREGRDENKSQIDLAVNPYALPEDDRGALANHMTQMLGRWHVAYGHRFSSGNLADVIAWCKANEPKAVDL